MLFMLLFMSWPCPGEDKAAVPVTDTEFTQSVNPQNFCTGVSLHHQALIQNSGPLIDMSDIRPGTSELFPADKGQTLFEDVSDHCDPSQIPCPGRA